MHPALKKEFKNLKALSQDSSLAIIETQLDHVAFISNGDKLICLAIEETKIHNMLSCFKVDLKKWKWAEQEGFNLEEGIPEELTKEILVKFKTPSEYLNYLNL